MGSFSTPSCWALASEFNVGLGPLDFTLLYPTKGLEICLRFHKLSTLFQWEWEEKRVRRGGGCPRNDWNLSLS